MDTLLLLAQAATPPAGAEPTPIMSFVPLIFIFVIFYFLLIRPQQKKQKELRSLVDSVKTGDKVITSAGIHGLVTNVKDRTVILKIAENVKVEFDKVAIVSVDKSSSTEVESAS